MRTGGTFAHRVTPEPGDASLLAGMLDDITMRTRHDRRGRTAVITERGLSALRLAVAGALAGMALTTAGLAGAEPAPVG